MNNRLVIITNKYTEPEFNWFFFPRDKLERRLALKKHVYLISIFLEHVNQHCDHGIR